MGRVERIEVRGVTRVYGGRAVLRGVTTTLSAGTATVIEGPNGAGKSTLLGVLGTLVPPTAGRVTYEPLGDDSRRVRGEIGWLAHESRTYRELTARENIALAARLSGVDPVREFARVEELLALGPFADQPVATLSRGQRQRIALARAVVHSPSVLLLDEPLTGLDPDSAERVEGLVAREIAGGTIVVVVSHSAGFAERLGARVLRLEAGRVVGGA